MFGDRKFCLFLSLLLHLITHSDTHTFRRTFLHMWSARRRVLYLTT